MPYTIRIAALIEANQITGPAKNLLHFATQARVADPEFPDAPLLEIHIVTFPRQLSNPFIEAAEGLDLPCHPLHERHALDLSVPRALGPMLKQIAPHILQTHSVKSHFLVRSLGLHRRYPWVAFHHGYTNENFKVRCYNQLDRWSLRATDHIVTVCQPFATQIEAWGSGRPITIIPNSIAPFPAPPEAAQIASLRQSLSLPEGAPVILHIGRFSHEKNHRGLLEAFAMLRDRLPGRNPQLVLIGDGVERAAIESAAIASPHRDAIHFTGHQSAVWPYFALASVFALPSWSEGSPNVLLEAMAAGVPIAASDAGGIPETAPHLRCALLCAPADTKTLADNLATLLNDPALVHSFISVGRQRLELFSPSRRRQRLTHLYQELAESADSKALSLQPTP